MCSITSYAHSNRHMEEVNKHTTVLPHILLCALWITTAMLIFLADDPHQLKAAFLLLPMLFTRQILVRGCWIDAAVLFLCLDDLTGCLTGINPLQTIYSFENSFPCLLEYLAIRYISTDNKNFSILLKGICLLAGIAVLLTILSFFVFQHSVKSAGFEELHSFRFLFRPLGYTINSWSTVLIAILGIILLTYHCCSSSKTIRLLLWSLFTITVFAILLSFSRGAYVTLLIYLILLQAGVKSRKYRLSILGGVLLAAGVAGYLFPQEIRTTILMNATVSQQRSNKGRIEASQAAWNIFGERMLCGAGKGNYTLAMDKPFNQDSTTYAPNILVQWGIEKGIAGILLYLFLAFCIGREWWKRRKRVVPLLASITLFAIFIKEMSLSTIYATPACAFLCALLLAMVQQPDAAVSPRTVGRNKLGYALLAITGISYLLFLVFIWQHHVSDNYRKESYSAYQQGNYREAIRLIEKTKGQIPDLIGKAVTYMKCFEQEADSVYLKNAEGLLAEAQRKMPEDVYLEYLQTKLWRMKGEENRASEKLHELATAYPKNALYHKDLSWLLYDRGRKEEAAYSMEKAIRLYPGILNMESTKQLERTDSAFYQRLKDALLKQDSGNAPTDYARYGYILYHCGDKAKAGHYLTKAVDALPNLSTPWFLLGEIKKEQHQETEAELCMKKFRLLSQGAFQFSSSSGNRNGRREVQDNDLMLEYILKLRNWYRSTIDMMMML